MRLADADGKTELLRLLVQRDRVCGRCSKPVITGAIAAPVVVDLGEHDCGAVAGPHRLSDANFGDRFDVLARRKIADAQLEALGAIVVDQRREQPPVGARLDRAQAEILLALGLDRLVEDDLILAAGDSLAVPRAILRPRPESPPVEIIAITDRDGRIVLLDPP